jgi:1-acyl-sn-glycerol-3-phosphate acyltransferase/nucleoside-diphosphate-sugar epimerase
MNRNGVAPSNAVKDGRAAARVVIIEPRRSLASLFVEQLNSQPDVVAMTLPDADGVGGLGAQLAAASADAVVYSPLRYPARDFVPDLARAEQSLQAFVQAGARKIVLLSSALVYGADYHNPGLIREYRLTPARCTNPVAEAWRAVEAIAARLVRVQEGRRLIILRPALALVPESTDWASRLFCRRWTATFAGFNPSIQLLAATDLAEAVCRAVASDAEGVFNIAPDGVVPLRHALREAGVVRIPVPWSAQRLVRAAVHRLGWSSSTAQQEYLRYSWTVSNERSRLELGMHYSAGALDPKKSAPTRTEPATTHRSAARRFDDFGMDEDFIRVRSRRGLGFIHRRYWRIEVRGLEYVPRHGPAVLVGVHRGFMPFDGVMMVHLLEKHVGRIPRFLMHPGLVKFPVLAPFLTNLGGIIACQENADYVLERDEILGVFPEGIRGAFRMYRDAYTLDRFGRSDFVKMALRHRAPIVPFVFLGTAETFPIFGKIEWSWWKRYTEWPYIPITPTFPLLPLPLPTKWHLQVLPPLAVPELYSPADAHDARVVRRIGDEVRDRMQEALDRMRRRRRSVFFGSIFDGEGALELAGTPAPEESLALATRKQETAAS